MLTRKCCGCNVAIRPVGSSNNSFIAYRAYSPPKLFPTKLIFFTPECLNRKSQTSSANFIPPACTPLWLSSISFADDFNTRQPASSRCSARYVRSCLLPWSPWLRTTMWSDWPQTAGRSSTIRWHIKPIKDTYVDKDDFISTAGCFDVTGTCASDVQSVDIHPINV